MLKVGQLQQHLEGHEGDKMKLIAKYEERLAKLQSEVKYDSTYCCLVGRVQTVI